jgi:hypothetical protein
MKNISSFTACKPRQTLLKANPETGIHPFQKHLAVSWPARWSVEKFQSTQLPEVLLPGPKRGRRRPIGCGSPRRGHKMQQV